MLKIFLIFKTEIHFFAAGIDSGFKIREIMLLWKLSAAAHVPDSSALFWSLPALERSIAAVLEDARSKGTETSRKTQDFLSRLYQFRTKVELDPKHKHGLSSTRGIGAGQKLRIVLKDYGVFLSSAVSVGRHLIVSLPEKDGRRLLRGAEWIGKTISVYFWRKNDAGYAFDTHVDDSGMYSSKAVLYLAHTESLVRMQKRRSVRSRCEIPAQMYILKGEPANPEIPEEKPGLKCLLEDISENGAMIRIGGKGIVNLRVKIQFSIDASCVVMCGFIRAVEYLDEKNQSRMHFECTYTNPRMRNMILSYVYNILPPEKKDEAEAMILVEKDAAEDSEKITTDDILLAEKTAPASADGTKKTDGASDGSISEVRGTVNDNPGGIL
ncbi:MAG: PilZ domain-containing protein [Bacteroides sp.]|nr:PilZ domain-containing protein [Prevotella sp.]MCM1407271.1 PilZ domain-containing protein [Treponema brennaborense]MCM1469759.1 PilZ domain-containing protein [Bacteroides sp.]